MNASTRHHWEYAPGELTYPEADAPLIHDILVQEVHFYVAAFRESGNGAHIWRAWRTARHLPEIPPEILRDFFSYFDSAAAELMIAERPTAIAQALRMSAASGARGEGNKATMPQLQDGILIKRYRHLCELADRARRKGDTEHAKTKKQIRERLAGEGYGANEAAVKQRILRVQRAGQYEARSRQR